MDQDLQDRIELHKQQIQFLKELVVKEAESTEDSGHVRAQTQLILKEGKSILDHAFTNYRKGKFPPPSPRAKIYFPIVPSAPDMASALGRAEMGDLSNIDSSAYAYLEGLQPYNSGQEWLACLSEVSGKSHGEVMPQDRKREVSITLADVVRVGGGGSVRFQNCILNGWLAEDVQIGPEGMTGKYDKDMPIKIEKKVSRFLKGTDQDVIELCEKVNAEISKIAEKFSDF